MPHAPTLLAAALLLLAAPAGAASAPTARSAQGIRAFLSVPVWYLSYEVVVDASGQQGGGDARLHSVATGYIVWQMFAHRARGLLPVVLNLLLLYKVSAFALAQGGANLRPTVLMLASFV